MASSAQETAELLKSWKASGAVILVTLARRTDFSVNFVGHVRDVSERTVDIKAEGDLSSLYLTFGDGISFEIDRVLPGVTAAAPDLKITFRDDMVCTIKLTGEMFEPEPPPAIRKPN